MGISDEAFVGALGRADGAPDLCEGNKEEAGVTVGPSGGRTGPVHDSPPPGIPRPPGVRTVRQVGKEETVGSCVPHPSILYCSGLQMSSWDSHLSVPGTCVRFHLNKGFTHQNRLKTLA